MPLRFKTFLRNTCVVMLSIIVGLGFVELVLRVMPSSVDSDQQKVFFKYDGLIGWVHAPDSKGNFITGEYKTYLNFNSNGVRGPQVKYTKPEGQYRILILGDSFAEGYSVNFEELFSEVLKQRLNDQGKSDRRFEVINLGVAGYSTDQEYLLFDNEGRKYQPDLTILMFYENDVWYNVQSKYWRGSKPKFEFNQGNLFLTSVPGQGNAADSSEPPALKQKLIKNVRLIGLIKQAKERSAFLYRAGMVFGLTKFPDELRVWKKTADQDIDNAWILTEHLIDHIHEDARLTGSQFLVVYVPSSASIYPQLWQETKFKYGISDEEWDIHQNGKRLSEICRKLGISFVDPTVFLRQKAGESQASNKMLYYKHDGHWTSQGHRVIGEFLEQEVDRIWISYE